MGGDKFRDWSVLRYSTLSCLLGTVSAMVIVLLTLFGFIHVPTMETIKIVSPPECRASRRYRCGADRAGSPQSSTSSGHRDSWRKAGDLQ